MRYHVIFDPGARREFGKLPKTQQRRGAKWQVIVDGRERGGDYALLSVWPGSA